jgi:hypothetical protein
VRTSRFDAVADAEAQLGAPVLREVIALQSPLILGDAAARPQRDPVGPVVDLDGVQHGRGEIGVEPAPEFQPHQVVVSRRVDRRARDVPIWMEGRRRVPADHNTGDPVVRTGRVVDGRIRVADLMAARFRRRPDLPFGPERPAARVVRERVREEIPARGGCLRRLGGTMVVDRKERAAHRNSQEQEKRGTPHVHRRWSYASRVALSRPETRGDVRRGLRRRGDVYWRPDVRRLARGPGDVSRRPQLQR